MKKLFLLIFLLFYFWEGLSGYTPAFSVKTVSKIKHSSKKYFLLVIKNKYRLQVYSSKTFKLVNEFEVGLGKKQGRKTTASDQKTPQGIYKITECLSRFSKNKLKRRKLKAMNQRYWRAKDGHSFYFNPKKDLGKNAYGDFFFRLSYPNKADKLRFKKLKAKGLLKRRAKIGTLACIHGTPDEASVGYPSSSGSIRLKRRDLITLSTFIQRGTIVIILP